ncbi:unnamed protein product [Urochloa humidicola]
MDRHDVESHVAPRRAVQYVRGVNWAPDSDEDDDPMAESDMQVEAEDPMAASDVQVPAEDPIMTDSEVQFVSDTYAGNTEVPDSQMDIDEVDEPDVVHALESFASMFHLDKVKHEGCSLMLPVLLPRLYGDNDDDVHGAAVSLLWMSRGYSSGVEAGVDARILDDEPTKNTEEVKMSMFKIIFPFMFDN